MNRAIRPLLTGLRPSLSHPRRLLAACLVLGLAACSPQGKINRILENAQKAYDAGDYEKAKAEYINVLRVDAKNAIAMRELGMIWFEEGAMLKAYPFLNRALEIQPDNAAVRSKLALVYLAFGDREKARSQALALLEKAPTNENTLVLLADSSSTPEQVDAAEQEIKKHSQPDRASVHLAIASVDGHRGDLAGAEKEVLKALELDPKSIPALLAKGSFCLVRKDTAGAEAAYKQAAEIAPLRSTARIKLIDLQLARGATKEAEAMLEDLTKKVPDYIPAWRARADVAYANQKFDDALAHLEKVFAVDVANFESRMLQAQAVLGKKDYKKAVSLLESLRSAYPKIPAVMYQLGRAQMYDGNFNQAQVVLNEAVQANPNYVDAVLLLGQVKLQLGEPQGDITLMQNLLKTHPNLMPAQLQLAEAHRMLGRFDEASAVYKEQIKLTPTAVGPYLLLGSILRQQDKNAEAREAFAKAHELAPDNPLPSVQLVDLDILDKNFQAAHQRVHDDFRKDPESPLALYEEGKIFAAQRQWEPAESTLLKALEKDGNYTDAFELLISTYVAAGKLDAAASQLEALLAKQSGNTSALFASGIIAERRGDFEKARTAYEKLIATTPDYAPALNNLAALNVKRFNQTDKAYDLVRKARALKAENPVIADTLGWILYKRGDYVQALAMAREAAAKLPESPEVQFHVGMAAYMMNLPDEAQKAFTAASAAADDFAGKDEIKPRLAVLQINPATASAAELEPLLQKQPGDLLLLLRLSEVYAKAGDAQKAVDVLERASAINSHLPPIFIKLAQLYAGRLSKLDKALEAGKKARELAPNDARVAGILGAITYQANDYVQAYGLLKESVSARPDDIILVYDFAWAAYTQGKVTEARTTMERVAAVPNSPFGENAKQFLAFTPSDAMARTGSVPAAAVDEALKKDPEYVPGLMARAAREVEAADSKAATATYTEVLHHFPNFAPAQKWLATLYVADPSKWNEGYDLAVKARKTLNDDPDLAKTLAEIAYQRKEYSYAIQLFEESARSRPLDAPALYFAGKSHLASNHTPEGKKALDQALAAGLQEPLATDARKSLTDVQQPKEK